MSMLDNFIVTVNSARITGAKLSDGSNVGGFYTPSQMKNGAYLPGRFACRVMLNQPDTMSNGVVREGKRVAMNLTIWSNHQQTSGQAEMAAKYLSPGKEVSLLATIETYQAQQKDQAGNVLTINGQPITYEQVSLSLVPGSLKLGRDSASQIQREIQNHATMGGQFSFFARPADWNITGSAGEAEWKAQQQLRKSAVCNIGNATFGYAKVNPIPAGSVFAPLKDVNYAAAATGMQTVIQPGTVQNGQTSVNPNAMAAMMQSPEFQAALAAMQGGAATSVQNNATVNPVQTGTVDVGTQGVTVTTVPGL